MAALNHPNIVTLYSVEEVGETLFITMEYVEGITLRDLLAKGPLQLPRFLEIVQQLTAAVAAAHEAGIIHRDLKPGNIMIVKDGQVKVLDFGLAKAAEPAAFDSDSDLSTEQRTRDGVVMGTPGYMSPEQARGQSVDGRTDIYALGVLFHEMLSGRRPLEAGATSLSEKPAIPLALARIVERCHGEDPSQRFQSAADLGFALTGIAEPAEIPTRRSRSSVRWSIPIAALVLGAALGALFSGETLPTLPETHFSISPPPGYELRRDQFRAMALSRDGRKLAIVAVKQGEASLFLRNMGELGLQPVPDSEGASDLCFRRMATRSLFSRGESSGDTISASLARTGLLVLATTLEEIGTMTIPSSTSRRPLESSACPRWVASLVCSFPRTMRRVFAIRKRSRTAIAFYSQCQRMTCFTSKH